MKLKHIWARENTYNRITMTFCTLQLPDYSSHKLTLYQR